MGNMFMSSWAVTGPGPQAMGQEGPHEGIRSQGMERWANLDRRTLMNTGPTGRKSQRLSRGEMGRNSRDVLTMKSELMYLEESGAGRGRPTDRGANPRALHTGPKAGAGARHHAPASRSTATGTSLGPQASLPVTTFFLLVPGLQVQFTGSSL